MQTTSSAETKKLVSAYLHGTGLSPLTNKRVEVIKGGRGTRHPVGVGGGGGGGGGGKAPVGVGGGGGGGGKAPSAMKTDVKEATAPYSLQKQRRT